MNVSINSVKSAIDKLMEEAYNDGYKDAAKYYADQPFSAARTEALSKTVISVQKDLRIAKKKLSLATKLLRHAQEGPCGQDGQFDRFFQEGYDAGYNDVPTEEVCDQGTLLSTYSDSV